VQAFTVQIFVQNLRWCIFPACGVARGGVVRPWQHFFGGVAMGCAAVCYKPAKAVLR